MYNLRKDNGTSINLPNLPKEPTFNELKVYFQKVLELKDSGNKFPVSLDEIWPLAYTQKRDAMRVLQREFIEGEEFEACQKGKVVRMNNLENGVKTDILVSVQVMEYLVARKKRAVFEVYREVFHQAIEANRKRGVKLLPHELPLFDILNQYLIKGDIKTIAEELNYHRSTVSRVKRGISRNRKIMEALLAKCLYNKENDLSDKYTSNLVSTQLDLFNSQNQLNHV